MLSSCRNDFPASKVPSIVQNAVKAKFPAAIDIEWEKNANVYEAEFDLNGIDHTVYVDSTGKLVSYKHDIKTAEFPAAVSDAIATAYGGYKIDDPEKVESSNI